MNYITELGADYDPDDEDADYIDPDGWWLTKINGELSIVNVWYDKKDHWSVAFGGEIEDVVGRPYPGRVASRWPRGQFEFLRKLELKDPG